ncbi:hypothetical protein ABZ613_37605 [Streptomyces collinus]|uniref:Uncharacterized protein n=2 Tax=Streptomyces TaxID=1883 RepID=A0AA89Q7V5_STRCU|nr:MULTISPECIES: hypothetical protein [Streptomyces]MBB5815866.1 hypothetical protein [Streptomyces collinus]MEC7051174.1 hypothetical protein [Streptomyces violaceochromogenes]WMX68745.1 hypothetical protein RFN52_37590 [Streptomyces collinus]GHC87047.1 hypothetical protein GCM10010309_66820 [Streptomyces violaceochromogenes]
MANYAGAGTTAGGTTGAGLLPVTGGPESIWFWIVVFVLVSAGCAALRLIPRKVEDDA